MKTGQNFVFKPIFTSGKLKRGHSWEMASGYYYRQSLEEPELAVTYSDL